MLPPEKILLNNWIRYIIPGQGLLREPLGLVPHSVSALSFRRKKLAINYCSKLYLQTSHPAHRYIFKPKLSRAFQQKPNATKPLSERVSSIIQQLKLIIINPIENHTPPWTYVKPKVNLHLSTLGKDITPSDLKVNFKN